MIMVCSSRISATGGLPVSLGGHQLPKVSEPRTLELNLDDFNLQKKKKHLNTGDRFGREIVYQCLAIILDSGSISHWQGILGAEIQDRMSHNPLQQTD